MSQYVHEIVLQEFIIENIALLDLNISYKATTHKLLDAKFNKTGTFWDLEGKLDNGLWIPVEVEWISENFQKHDHNNDPSFAKFIRKKGILIVLRKSQEIENIHQYGILDTIPQKRFKALFSSWLKKKSPDYSDSTLNDFLVGNYKRKLQRILVIPVSANADRNYFSMEPLYRKNKTNPLVLGFKENGYVNNEFVRDIQPGDIALFIKCSGARTKRKVFISKIKKKQLLIKKLVAFQIRSKLFEIESKKYRLDKFYWPDEIKENKLIYPYRCKLADHSFIKVENIIMPDIDSYTEEKWELLRSCIQYGAYFEMSANDFLALISNL